MVRDTTEGKIDFSLALDGPMFKRYAIHLTKGAIKYAKRNWMKARGQEEFDRFRESALRHFLQWYDGDTDEDHAAAVWFNINGAEYVKEQLHVDPVLCFALGPVVNGDARYCILPDGHSGYHRGEPEADGGDWSWPREYEPRNIRA